jgi:hypothetical protein
MLLKARPTKRGCCTIIFFSQQACLLNFWT